MKNAFLTLLAGILLLVLANSCNKTSTTNPGTVECINSSFIDTLEIGVKPTYVEEDNKGNITILGNNKGVIAVVRLNAEGELQWHKEYPQLQGKEQGLVYVDENSFLIKTSTRHYEYELHEYGYYSVWIQNGIMLDSSNNYLNTYEIIQSYQPKLQLPNTNTSYLTKISSHGNILWTKEFLGDYCNGNSLYRIDQNNFLFLTSDLFGPYFELIDHADYNNDTVSWPFDKNKRTVYKINNEGGVIWSTEINNIFSTEKLFPKDISTTYYRHAISKNGERIIINTKNTTHELSESGVILKSYQPRYNFQGNNTWLMAKADETANYFLGVLRTHDNPGQEYYLMKYDVAQNQTIWLTNEFNYPYQISSYPDKGFIFYTFHGSSENYSISKFNTNGNEVWNKVIETPNFETGIRTITAACNGGAIIAMSDYLDEKIIIIKTNENGEY